MCVGQPQEQQQKPESGSVRVREAAVSHLSRFTATLGTSAQRIAEDLCKSVAALGTDWPLVYISMSADRRGMDPPIWKAIAGGTAEMPTVDSRVYYFPQGYAEQCSSPPELRACHPPVVMCRTISVKFAANPDTDEVFSKLRLEPISPVLAGVPPPVHPSGHEDEDAIESFSKTLTPSDANNGGGFSVPRYCADRIFPPLDYHAEPPVQTISVMDVHGVMWDFRHIYRGTPRRHLLTTGWSKFVNQKKLVAGDSVVFMKNKNGELFVGIRRTVRTSYFPDSGARWNPATAVSLRTEECGGGGFSRSGRGKISPHLVLDATELAASGRPFDVVYYPRIGSSDFVVRADIVEQSMRTYWTVGMRVKMAMETEDATKMSYYQGVIHSVGAPDGLWKNSPWRMLQVNWDEPDVFSNVRRVNPWQVGVVSGASDIEASFASKKIRLPSSTELLDGDGPLLFPITSLASSVVNHFNSSLFENSNLPAGMQGARHDAAVMSGISPNIQPFLYPTNLLTEPNSMFSEVSTELSIGGASVSDSSSLQNQGTFHFTNTEVLTNHRPPFTKSAGGSFQLFGKIIQMEGGGCQDKCVRGCQEIGSVGASHDSSSAYPLMQLCNQLDAPCQQVSTLGACTL